MEDYKKELMKLNHKIMAPLLKALCANQDQQASLHLSEGTLQLNSYPKCRNSSQALGIVPHTDTAMVTIFHQTEVGSLQLFEEDEGWVTVAKVPGALVVNLGDFMHILSNGLFPTPLHRSIPSETGHRYSMVLFGLPPADFIVEPLSSGSPKFRPMTVKEFVEIKCNSQCGCSFPKECMA